MRRIPARSTGLYAIRTDASGERHFSYWRDASAARAYFDAPQTPLEARAHAIDLLVLSGITLAVMHDALHARLLPLLDRIRAGGGRIAFDGNHRARLWPHAAAARAAYDAALVRTDIALLTLEDLLALDPPPPDARSALAAAFALPCDEVVIKRGAQATLVRRRGDRAYAEAPVEPVARPVDTTAAGDSFDAGYLVQRLAGADPLAAAAYGNRVARIVVGHPGAIVPSAALDALR